MNLGKLRIAVVVALTSVMAVSAATSTAQLRRSDSRLQHPLDDVEDNDARRAAAGRLLAASHFRERQAVSLKEAIRAARSDMQDECLNRAAAGRTMTVCESITTPTSATLARLADNEANILDEIVSASQTVYARRFTVAEMDEITRFFRSPVGQRYSNTYPTLLGEVQDRRRVILRRYLIATASAQRRVL